MGEPPPVRVDVRDMQCAQALAQAGVAMKGLVPGAMLELICNAEDVQHDLLVWAKELHYPVVASEVRDGDTWLTIQKGP